MQEDKIASEFSLKKTDKSILLRLASLFVGLLIICAMNLPPIEAAPSLVIINTVLGSLSLTRILIILTLLLFSLVILFTNIKLRINIIDVLAYIMAIIALIYNAEVSKGAYFILIISSSYLIGRFIRILNLENLAFTTIKISGLVQSLLVLYTIYISPIVTQVNGSMLFKQYTSGVEGILLNERASGTIGNPVVLGALLLPSLVCWFCDILHTEKGLKFFLSFIPISIIAYSVFLTYSRGTWLAFILVTIIILYKKKLIKNVFVWLLSCIVVFLLSMTPLADDFTARLSLTNDSDFSVTHRSLMYYWSFNIICENVYSFFVGYGFGGSKIQLMNKTPGDGFPVIDNLFLSMLVDLGIIGVIMLLYIIYKSIVININTIKYNWISFILLAMCFNSLTFDVFYWEPLGFIFWFMLGIANSNEFNGLNELSKRKVNL